MKDGTCPLCGRETLKARMQRPPPTADVEAYCLHQAHIYGNSLPPCESLGVERIAQACEWLNTISGAAFFGATAPDTSTMQFTITLNAAEWREIRALVDGSK